MVITIEGISGEGKSTIARFINKCLKNEGFNVKLIDHDQYVSRIKYFTRLDSIVDDTNILIETKQAKR